jgi:DNA-binding NtrC family response regulator
MSAVEASGSKILLVDDERESCQRLCWSLGTHGYKTEEVPGPREALARLRREEFVAVVCDLRLTRIPGLDLVREVQSFAGFRPWVMDTGVPRPSATRRGEQTRVYCILTRGAPVRDLLWSVEEACRVAYQSAPARCA